MSLVLDSFGIDPNDPEVIAIQEDFNDFAELIAVLVERRKMLGLTQTEVARLMETKQSAVSAIESSSANPTVQRLQRYARAVGARLMLNAHEQVAITSEWRMIDSAVAEDTFAPQHRPNLMLVGGSEWNEWETAHAA